MRKNPLFSLYARKICILYYFFSKYIADFFFNYYFKKYSEF
jgi:hypothetical protein